MLFTREGKAEKVEGVPFSSLLESELKSFDRLLRIIFEK